MTFTVLDIILFLGISQGLFLSISLRLVHDRNKNANRMLSLLLLIAVLMLFGRIAAYRISEIWVWRFGVLMDTTIFLFGPFIYCYARRLVFKENPLFKLSWWHYIPSCFHLGYYFWGLQFSLADFNTIYFSGRLNLMFFLVELLGMLSLLAYWTATVLLYQNYMQKEKGQLSFRQNVSWYLLFLLITLGLFLGLWVFSFINLQVLGKPLRYINYTTMWISTPLFVYVIGYFSLRQPDIFRIAMMPKPKNESNRLKPEKIQKIQKRLRYFMEEENIYLESNLSLNNLADKLNSTPNDLSWFLNQVHQVSFYEYINSYRIKAFLKKLELKEHANHTLLAIAMDVGFNSKSTFNRVFKSEMGVTPKQYLKTKHVA